MRGGSFKVEKRNLSGQITNLVNGNNDIKDN